MLNMAQRWAPRPAAAQPLGASHERRDLAFVEAFERDRDLAFDVALEEEEAWARTLFTGDSDAAPDDDSAICIRDDGSAGSIQDWSRLKLQLSAICIRDTGSSGSIQDWSRLESLLES